MKPHDLRRRLLAAAAPAVGASAAAFIAGCGGTSPQLTAPTLTAPNAGRTASTASTALTAAAEASLAPLDAVTTPAGSFTTLPYLQPGDSGSVSAKSDTLTVVWQSADAAPQSDAASWLVETRPAGGGDWATAKAAPASRRMAAHGVTPIRVWSEPIDGLLPGSLFDYRVSLSGKPVFAARGRARRASDQTASHFVVLGDGGAGTPAEKKIAYQTSVLKPDYLILTDEAGAHREDADKGPHFFSIYNSDAASADTGAPLLRSIPVYAVVGSHDAADYKTSTATPDALAYFEEWRLPMNGPIDSAAMPGAAPVNGAAADKKTPLANAGDAYPRMASYSFDYGSAHWLVLDANPYVDWSSESLRAWVEKDLKSAKSAAWKFVAFHQPPFNSAVRHRDDQQMRVLCDLFEKYGVDVVWSGQIHNYQRTYPMHFAAKRGADGKWRDSKNRVPGAWTLDKEFDGDKKTYADGVVYVNSGAGGGPLQDQDIQLKPADWQSFTKKYIADTHSLTDVVIADNRLTVRQLSEDGKELDTFTLTK